MRARPESQASVSSLKKKATRYATTRTITRDATGTVATAAVLLPTNPFAKNANVATARTSGRKMHAPIKLKDSAKPRVTKVTVFVTRKTITRVAIGTEGIAVVKKTSSDTATRARRLAPNARVWTALMCHQQHRNPNAKTKNIRAMVIATTITTTRVVITMVEIVAVPKL
jgi:hypothetical protein